MKNKPEGWSSIIYYNVPRNKGFFYIGKSENINSHKGDCYNTNYGISSWSNKANCYKIGITKNLNSRLSNYKQEILDFEYLNAWEIKAYKYLELSVKNDNYKSGFTSYGSEWFIGSEYQYYNLVEDIEERIDSTYYEKNGRFYLLYGKEYKKIIDNRTIEVSMFT